jgi:type I restriction enzyme M protein
VGFLVARIVSPEPGMEIYDPCCGSGGLLVKCEIVLDEKTSAAGKKKSARVRAVDIMFVAAEWEHSSSLLCFCCVRSRANGARRLP